MASVTAHLDDLIDHLMTSLRSLPLVSVLGEPAARIPVASFVVAGVPAERVVQRLADNGVLATTDASSRVLDLIGVNEIGGAVTVGLAPYTTIGEVDQMVRALASLG
jgi:selenocysteine lyase/cysteine desulfurase